MPESDAELRTRVRRLERLFRDIAIGVIILGISITAFLGYQSWAGIPRAVKSALEGEAVAKLIATIEESERDATKSASDARARADEIEELVQRLKEKLATVGNVSQPNPEAISNFKALKDSVARLTWQISQIRKAGNISSDLEARLKKIEEVTNGRFLYLENHCDRPIKLALRYRMPYGQWRSVGWWSLSSDASSYLTESEDRRIVVTDRAFFYYAETTDSSDISWKGETAIELKGETLAMRAATLEEREQDYVFSLKCEQPNN